MRNLENKDYASSGLTIQYAKLDQAKSIPNKAERPKFIIWDGKQACTSLVINTPETFKLRAKFISKPDIRQGFDLKVYKGQIMVPHSEGVSVLRTWSDPKYEQEVFYEIKGTDGRLGIWNVYKMSHGSKVVEEKWTENAGFYYENPSKNRFRFHCSPGWSHPPDFESLVFEIELK